MKLKYIGMTLLLVCLTFSVTAQQKLTKASEKINVTKDVNIDLNTSYVEIEIDTWNKNTLEIEAFIEDEKMSKEELQKALKNWDLKIEGSGDYVKISSEGSPFPNWDGTAFTIDLEDLNLDLDYLRNLEDFNIYIQEMPEFPELPELPEMPELAEVRVLEMPQVPEIPELPKGVKNVSFDTEAYEKEGEAYLERWSSEYAEKYGDKYKEEMKAWGRKMAKVDFSDYEKEMEEWGERFGKDYEEKMAVWGKKFEESFDEEWAQKMEEWGEKYGKEMEQRAIIIEKQLAKRQGQIEDRAKLAEERAKIMEERAKVIEERAEARAKAQNERRNRVERRWKVRTDNVKKTIKIKMPKDAKLNMNVRHGELKLGSVIHNLKADISHAVLLADHIDGSETSINVAYSPVVITTWNLGQLNLKYVEDARIENVNRIVLNSNSSDIVLANLNDNAIIDGSFGDLVISRIANSFSNLNIILENSEALISLPKTDYSVFFKGNRSRLNNEMTSQKTIENYVNGQGNPRAIVVNAKFSDVILKN